MEAKKYVVRSIIYTETAQTWIWALASKSCSYMTTRMRTCARKPSADQYTYTNVPQSVDPLVYLCLSLLVTSMRILAKALVMTMKMRRARKS